jgi:hypothetical protein
MLLSQRNAVSMALYALERIASLEAQRGRVLGACSVEARGLVLERRPDLRRWGENGGFR